MYDIHDAEREIVTIKKEIQELKKEAQDLKNSTLTNTQDILLLSFKLDKLDNKLDKLEGLILPKLAEISTNTTQLRQLSNIGWKFLTPLISAIVGGFVCIVVYVLRLMN